MTFAEFTATGRDSALGQCEDIYYCGEEANPDAAVRVYNDALVIEDSNAWTRPSDGNPGRWYLMLGNAEYHSDDLAQLEALLYEFAQAEGLA